MGGTDISHGLITVGASPLSSSQPYCDPPPPPSTTLIRGFTTHVSVPKIRIDCKTAIYNYTDLCASDPYLHRICETLYQICLTFLRLMETSVQL